MLIFFLGILNLVKIGQSEKFTQNSCNLKISQNRFTALFSDNIIFNKGEIDEKWKTGGFIDPYVADLSKEIEFLHAVEVHGNEVAVNHQPLRVEISSDNTSVSTPQVDLQTDDSVSSVHVTTIVVKYMCHTSIKGSVKIHMTVTSDQCETFSLEWVKICKEKGHMPKVNIGTKPGNSDILHEGMVKNENIFYLQEGKRFILEENQNTLALFISSAFDGKSHLLRRPELTFDVNSLEAALSGSLASGAVLGTEAEPLVMAIECKPLRQTKTDIMMTLRFENNDIINLFFEKHCNSVGEAPEYFNFLYTVYWIFLFLIMIFLLTAGYYYLKRNDLSIVDSYLSLINFIVRKYDSYRRNGYLTAPQRDPAAHEEEDTMDVNIKTGSKEINDNNFKADYGGI